MLGISILTCTVVVSEVFSEILFEQTLSNKRKARHVKIR